jgi:hypothetical protein
MKVYMRTGNRQVETECQQTNFSGVRASFCRESYLLKDMKICTAEKTALREVVGDGDVGDLVESLT